MANLREWLEAAEVIYGEPIEAMVVGRHDDASWSTPLSSDEGVILTREIGLRKVDQEYDNGYGGADCFPLYAWTGSRVFFVYEYDGATSLQFAPRNPTQCEPEFSGQSIALDICPPLSFRTETLSFRATERERKRPGLRSSPRDAPESH